MRAVQIADIRTEADASSRVRHDWCGTGQAWRRAHRVGRPDGEGERRGRGADAVPPGSPYTSPISRSSWSRTSLPKPSSPSRTRGCSTNCGSAPRSRREALEQQTATSEVLAGHQQLSRRSSAGICGDAREGRTDLRCQIREYLPLGWRCLHLVAAHNTPPAFAEHRRRRSHSSGPQSYWPDGRDQNGNSRCRS